MKFFSLLIAFWCSIGWTSPSDGSRPFAKSLGWKPIPKGVELPLFQMESDVVYINTPELLDAAQKYYEATGEGNDEGMVSVSVKKVPKWSNFLKVGPKDQIYFRALSNFKTLSMAVSEIATFEYQYSAGGGGIHKVGFRVPPKKALGSGLAWIGMNNPFANGVEVKTPWSDLPVPPNLKNALQSAVKADVDAKYLLCEEGDCTVSNIEHKGLVVGNIQIGVLKFKVHRSAEDLFAAYYLQIGSEKFFVDFYPVGDQQPEHQFAVGKFLNDYELFINVRGWDDSVILVSKKGPQFLAWRSGIPMGG